MDTVFIVLAIAAATKLNGHWPQAEQHSIMIFTQAHDATEAVRLAAGTLDEEQWTDITIKSVSTMSGDEASKAGDQEKTNAFKAAMEGKSAIIVSTDPYRGPP